jgi:exopolysaccharide production protein ExoQ
VWSPLPERVVRRVVAVAAEFGFALFIFRSLSFRQFRRYSIAVFGLLTFASAIFAIIFPDLGQTTESGQVFWNGVFETKNNFGSVLLVGNCFYLSALLDREHVRLAWLCLVMSIVCIYLSGCKTAEIVSAVLVIICLSMAFHRLIGRPHATRTFVACVMLFAVSITGIAWSSSLLSVEDLGSFGTLTGRLPLWQSLMSAVAERPVFGYGLDSFYRTDNDHVLQSQSLAGWRAMGAHNGYVDILLSLGVVGLFLFLLLVVPTFLRAWKRMAARSEASTFAALFAFALILQNMAEPFAFRPWSVWTALTVYSYMLVHPDSCVRLRPRPALKGD